MDGWRMVLESVKGEDKMRFVVDMEGKDPALFLVLEDNFFSSVDVVDRLDMLVVAAMDCSDFLEENSVMGSLVDLRWVDSLGGIAGNTTRSLNIFTLGMGDSMGRAGPLLAPFTSSSVSIFSTSSE